MASTLIENYITKRYERWLDYSNYHCEMAGMPDEASDVLNEVLCNLLQKDNAKLERLFQAKKNGYTELDFFVLRMIKLNATSDTSPYRNKYKPFIPTEDVDFDFSRVEIEDVREEVADKNTIILDRFHQVRDALESLDLAPSAKRVFEFRFFEDGNFNEWDEGSETLKQLYEIYNKVLTLVRKKINGESIF